MFGRLVLHSRWTRSYFFFSFELSYLRAVHKGQDCQDLVGSRQAGQKALEVRTPLVQNGADEHGPHRGDITAEWAKIGRISHLVGDHSPDQWDSRPSDFGPPSKQPNVASVRPRPGSRVPFSF